MTLLILGGSGQVGFELRRQLAPLGEIVAPSRAELDLMSAAKVAAALDTLRPTVIVNAAAWTAVDAAEKERAAAQRLNAELPAQLADFAAGGGCELLHYSSDYVYPGSGEAPWQETSATGPLGHYGATKLAGDEALLTTAPEALILRTSWVYAARGRNFLDTMLRLGAERERLGVVADQIGAPTPARLIATLSLLALRARLAGQLPGGVYHLATRGETSWHGFACEIFAQARARGVPLALADDQAVGAIATADYPTPARRPLNSRLALDKLERALGVRLPDWRTQLALTLDERLG